MNDLEKLRNCRDQLLKAEVAAWLHDMGKCADAFLEPNGMGITTNCKGHPRANPHKAIFSPNDLNDLRWWSNLTHERGQCAKLEEANHDTALWKTLSRLSEDLSFIQKEVNLPDIGESSLGELILWGRPLVAEQYQSFEKILDTLTHLAASLGHSHKIAHMEKEDIADGGISGWVCSPFGANRLKISNLDYKLKDVLICQNNSRREFISQISQSFKGAPGDNRWPINEVTLWDWSFIVAALYKSELARSCLLKEKRHPRDMKWRLLNIQIDGWKYLTISPGIPDLLARSALFSDALNRVQMLLEETYPLSLEVYRDENGSIFVVPDIKNLLDVEIDSSPLSKHILDVFQQGTVYGEASLGIRGEVVPMMGPVSEEWDGTSKLPPISNILSQKNFLYSDNSYVRNAWIPVETEVGDRRSKFFEQICTVCGLRPQGYGAHDRLEHYRRKTLKKECPTDCQTCKAIKRGVCSICEQRRDDRSMRWARERLSTTIWIDEVADANGRLALVAGCFDLSHWLSGDLVRTMAVCNPANSDSKEAEKVAKNPSFARLRRIWETTRGFWQEVYPTDENRELHDSLMGNVVGLAGPRLEIRGKIQQKNGTEAPGPFHAYDLVLPRGIKLSVAWDPENERSGESKGRFITIDNLTYLASLAGKKAPSREKDGSEEDHILRPNNWAAEKLKELIHGTIPIEESTGYGGKAKEWGEINVDRSDIISGSQYTPAISILAEPRTFMALVPADKALDVVNKIKAKYEREMGKVRNRLPLHLGIVYAHRRTPLRAILDAGRKMLDQKYIGDPGAWTVTDNVIEQSDMLPHKAAYLSEDSSQFTKWYPVCLKHQEMNRELVWYVPAVMGDGTTSDNWYPYVFWSQDRDGNTEPANATVPRSRYFKSLNPWKKDDSAEPDWLVHAGELKEGDLIYFTPATLDFQWLDSAGRRFEIAYDERGQRCGLSRRPYLLDEIENLDEIWQTLSSHLTKNQIYILRDLIEVKREDWNVKSPKPIKDVFWNFCWEALSNAQWTKGKKDNRKEKLPWEAEGKDRKQWLDQWADYAVRGWITDAIELHLQIMKEEVQDEF